MRSSRDNFNPRVDYSRQNVLVHIFYKDVWRHNLPIIADVTEGHYANKKLCSHFGHIFRTRRRLSVVLFVACLILVKVFLVGRKTKTKRFSIFRRCAIFIFLVRNCHLRISTNHKFDLKDKEELIFVNILTRYCIFRFLAISKTKT